MLRLYQPQLILLDNFLLMAGIGSDSPRRQHQLQRANHFITADNHMDTISEALRLGYLIT